MNENLVRIKTIEIKDYKNIQYGKVDLCKHFLHKGTMLGIFGQNGSGKSAFIDAILLLKMAISGQSIPSFYIDFIRVGSKKSEMTFTFDIFNEQSHSEVVYHFCLNKQHDFIGNDNTSQTTSSLIPKIESETLYLSSGNHKIKIIDTDLKTLFTSDCGHSLFPETHIQEIRYIQKLASSLSKSFVFSNSLLNMLKANNKCSDKHLNFIECLEILVNYGTNQLFILNNHYHTMINYFHLPLQEPTVIPEYELESLYRIVNLINTVLIHVIPGLEISVQILDTSLLSNGNISHTVHLMSKKGNICIPLSNESEGIQRIVEVLYMLILVYNKFSVTVVIDDMDLCIFEYLFGELLRIILRKGKGQLIFTSHNLRPLETIDDDFIIFTTTNPQNRYIKSKNIQSNNNLRDVYYKNIVLGGTSEDVYHFVHNSEIDFAFQEASEYLNKQ